MLSKEEIKKAKKKLELMEYKYTLTDNDDKAIETLLQYIDQLEQENNKLNKINDEMVGSFYKLYQKIPGTMHKFFENGKPCEYGYDKETNECKEINCKPCIKQYFEKKVEEK